MDMSNFFGKGVKKTDESKKFTKSSKTKARKEKPTVAKFISLVTLKEGKRNSLNRGDVSEVVRIIFSELAQMDILDVAQLLRRYKKK